MSAGQTKTDIIKEFMQDYLELNYHAKEEAQECGKTLKQYLKDIAVYEFDTRLADGSIIKVGRKFLVK